MYSNVDLYYALLIRSSVIRFRDKKSVSLGFSVFCNTTEIGIFRFGKMRLRYDVDVYYALLI